MPRKGAAGHAPPGEKPRGSPLSASTPMGARDLPELNPQGRLSFACHESLPCFGRCCRQLALPLPPYDALRLRRALRLGEEEFLSRHCDLLPQPPSGLPLAFLRMGPAPAEACPFLAGRSCSVYTQRPGACRAYPLGRGVSPAPCGVRERLYLVREEHCLGFDRGSPKLPASWLAEQGFAPYAAAADRLMRLMAQLAAAGAVLSPGQRRMARICLYLPGRLRQIIVRLRIPQRIGLGRHKPDLILRDSRAGDEAALEFGLDWLEMSIFGRSPGFYGAPGAV